MRKVALISAISISVTLLFITGFSRPVDAQVRYGCYHNKDVTKIRTVDRPGECKDHETVISWWAAEEGEPLIMHGIDLQSDVARLQAQVADLTEFVCAAESTKDQEPPLKMCFGSYGNPKVVFVTSQRYHPDWQYVAGADNICQHHAETAGLPGTYKAWLSTPCFCPSVTDCPQPYHSFSIANRFDDSFVLVDGTVIANSFTELKSGLLAPIDLTENGERVTATPGVDQTYVWTATTAEGDNDECDDHSYCTNWDRFVGGGTSMIGICTATDFRWTWADEMDCGGYSYFGPMRLYCFQQ